MVEANAISSAYQNYLTTISAQMGISLGAITTVMIILSLWALAWKGVALWKAGRKNQLIWFVVLLILNDFGILEILYIFIFSKMKVKEKLEVKVSKSKKK